MTRTADYLLNGLKGRAVIPNSQNLFDDDGILGTADDIISSQIVPLIVSLREEFLVTKSYDTITDGQEDYDIPYRAVGRILRELKVTSADRTSKRKLTNIGIGDEHYFQSSGTPQGFYIRGDKIVLVPAPTTTGNLLEKWWMMQPGKLVKTTDAANVVTVTLNVDPTYTDVLCGSIPADWLPTDKFDFTQGKQGCQTLSYDIMPFAISGSTLTFLTTDIPATLSAGDWISYQQECPVIQIPDEMYGVLESQVAQDILTSIGDFDGAKMIEKEISGEETRIKMLLAPRVQGEPKKIINRSGLLRASRARSRLGWMSR